MNRHTIYLIISGVCFALGLVGLILVNWRRRRARMRPMMRYERWEDYTIAHETNIGRDQMNAGRDVIVLKGDLVHGDKVHGDKIQTEGDVHSHTGGRDALHAEGDIHVHHHADEAPKSSDPDWHHVLTEELHRLSYGNIMFNPPDTMKVNATERVEVRISQDPARNLIEALKGKGDPIVETIRVGPLMSARLTGKAFEIVDLSTQDQVIEATEFTQWSWDVIPREPGKQTLHLHVVVRLPVLDKEQRKDLPVMDREIMVVVNSATASNGSGSDVLGSLDKAKTFLEKVTALLTSVTALLTALAVFGAGLVAFCAWIAGWFG
ncbi:MAG: hypothetical protein AAB353_09420 [Candidatus Hydrogenedentota bacterium]